MAAEVKVNIITPTTGNTLELTGNVEIGSDANPKALDVKGNMTSGGNFTTSGDVIVGGDIIADNFHATETPSENTHLITKEYLENVGGMSEGYLYGYEISNGSTPDEQIDIQPGTCKDSTNTRPITLAAGTTINITASGAGGLDTGTVANDTWYYIWAIYNTSTGITDAMFSASAVNPTLPSGYDYKRRIRGAVLTDGTADIIPFTQNGDYFYFNTRILDYQIAAATPIPTTKTAINISTPTSLIVQARILFWTREGGVRYINIMGYNEEDIAPVSDNSNLITESGNMQIIQMDKPCENGTIYWRANITTGIDMFSVYTEGFFDKAQD